MTLLVFTHIHVDHKQSELSHIVIAQKLPIYMDLQTTNYVFLRKAIAPIIVCYVHLPNNKHAAWLLL